MIGTLAEELRNEIKIAIAGSARFAVESFVGVYMQRLEDAEILYDANVEALQCRGPRGRKIELMGYAEDLADGTLSILCADYFGVDTDLGLSDLRKTTSRAIAFLEDAVTGWLESHLEPSSREAELAEYFRQNILSGSYSRIRVVLATDGFINERVRYFEGGILSGVKVSYELWDQRRILELEQSNATSEEIDIVFDRWLPSGLPCLLAGSDDSSLRSYLAVLPANILADIFAEYGSLLLESNVRTFLSARGSVNSGIQHTLKNEPDRFLAYNNGLTATALSVEVDDVRRGTCIKSIRGLQIVNGGQTTASIAHFLRAAKGRSVDGVAVQMKLVVVDPSNSSEIVNSVAKYANSQNKVSGADLFSTHGFHVRLEQLSRSARMPAKPDEQFRTGWYYERVRGQWENDRVAKGSTSEQRRFEIEYPKSQRITKTDWAKYSFCWDCKPHIVSKGAQSAFGEFAITADSEWETAPGQFDESYFREGVAKAIMYKRLRAAVLKEDWYADSPGYLANIVAYAISGLSAHISHAYSDAFDFEKVWKKGDLGADSLASLLELARIAKDHLTSSDRPNANVTQWAKQVECWNRFKGSLRGLKLDIASDLVVSRVPRERVRTLPVTARLRGRGSSPTSRILSVSDEIWSLLEEDGRLTKNELNMVRAIRSSNSLPTARGSSILLGLLDRMADQGTIESGSY